MDSLFKKIKITDSLRKYTFEQFLKKMVTKNIFNYIKDTYPYSDMFKTNAYDAINLYKKGLNIDNEFYILIGGLSQVIDTLEIKIKNYGGKIIKKCNFTSYKKIEKNVFL